jgi:hypothetical protein
MNSGKPPTGCKVVLCGDWDFGGPHGNSFRLPQSKRQSEGVPGNVDCWPVRKVISHLRYWGRTDRTAAIAVRGSPIGGLKFRSPENARWMEHRLCRGLTDECTVDAGRRRTLVQAITRLSEAFVEPCRYPSDRSRRIPQPAGTTSRRYLISPGSTVGNDFGGRNGLLSQTVRSTNLEVDERRLD